jgi:DNA repair protein RadC
LILKQGLIILEKTENCYLTIKQWPEDERPREKLIKTGCVNLTNAELLAIILRTGCGSSSRKQSALDIAKTILLQYKDLNDISELSVAELAEIKGIGWAKAAQIMASFELGRRKAAEKNGSNISFRCSEEVANYYIPLLKDLKNEQFRLVMLNIKNRIIREVMVSQGSLTSSIVHPREVLKIAIKASAASVIFLHNHPSGDPEPSIDDIEITNRLCKSCSIIGINVLDHLIIAENGYFSFKQKNML